ncbi:polysaccharide ABC transporter permease protein [Rhizobium phaseoli]|uniref:ABC transporter permease n=1 Tax=Rhizobium phaseoli TaxID=396 RepID=UPI0007EB58BD|nr:ABC transporter permease [Rhizobium phaseoli]ANM02937.1 polysaccharide ABC transporter permease protein [Rhizobium phaseoli]
MTEHLKRSTSAREKDWDVVIKPSKGNAPDLGLVWRYRDLVWMFFKRDFTTFYKQTVLGPVWYIIQPSLTAMTYYIVFGKIANLSTDGLPPFLFYMSGTIIWSYLASCLTNNSEVFSKNANLFGKVYFPRLVVPLSVAMSGLVAFAIQFLLLLTVAVGMKIADPDLALSYRFLFLTPLVLLYTAVLGIGAGLVVSALTVRFRDLVYAVGFMTQLWMYATPIVYPFSQIPERYHWFYYINPMTTPVQAFRSALFDVSALPVALVLANLAVTVAITLCGLALFSRAETNAMDTV